MKQGVSIAVILAGATALLFSHSSAEPAAHEDTTGEGPAILWREPKDIATRDLYYGPGGEAHMPKGNFTFVSEDTGGASPKFEVVGDDGVRWKVKLGIECRGETAASRLVWAVGYFANEDYLVPELRVNKMHHLSRGGKQVSDGGMVHDARWKRHGEDEKRLGTWSWSNNPFKDTREWNGLRVLMALINNWDLKDVNNAIYQVGGNKPERHYFVSDLGASLGTTGLNRGLKGNLKAYQDSKWINSITPERMDFNVPSAPSARYILEFTVQVQRAGLLWIGHGVPRADARWMGDLLAKLSAKQIRDAFRAAGYSPEEIEGFSRVVERRIAELEQL
jgi:hypothetical protein